MSQDGVSAIDFKVNRPQNRPAMSRLLLILDDDRARLRGFDEIMPRLGKEWGLKAWRDAPSMIEELWLPVATQLVDAGRDEHGG